MAVSEHCDVEGPTAAPVRAEAQPSPGRLWVLVMGRGSLDPLPLVMGVAVEALLARLALGPGGLGLPGWVG